MAKNIVINLDTPITEWRRNCTFYIDKKDMQFLHSILPPNVKQMYINDKGKQYHIKLILWG